MVTIGVLYVDILGYFGSWRWLTVGCLLSCVIWAISLLFVPETPAFLLQRRKFDEARDAMEVRDQIDEITLIFFWYTKIVPFPF